MECRQCQERMDLYLAEVLAGRWIEQFEQHIAECPRCARRLEQKQQLLKMLHGLSAPTPPEDLSTRIKAAAEAQLHRPQPQVRPAYYLKVAAACAVVVLAVGIGVVWRAPSARQATAPSFTSGEVTVAAERLPQGTEAPMISAASRPATKPEEPAEPSTTMASLPYRARAESAAPQPRAFSSKPAAAPETSGVEESVTAESAAPQGPAGPELKLARVPSARLVQTAEVRNARMPTNLVRAAARIDSGSELSLARTDATQAAQVELAGRTLVGTVVANAVLSQYVREVVIESDKTMMALTASAPSSMIEVTARDAETPVD